MTAALASDGGPASAALPEPIAALSGDGNGRINPEQSTASGLILLPEAVYRVKGRPRRRTMIVVTAAQRRTLRALAAGARLEPVAGSAGARWRLASPETAERLVAVHTHTVAILLRRGWVSAGGAVTDGVLRLTHDGRYALWRMRVVQCDGSVALAQIGGRR